MKLKLKDSLRWTGLAGAALGLGSCATTAVVAPPQLAGQECVRPPVLHCPEEACPGDMVIDPGPALEPETDRNFFIDYPCDLREGEEVVFVLNLHGGGSYGNWQRHYFPIFDYVDEHRLVVATPNSPVRVWRPEDDAYLQNIVDLVYDQFGDETIRSFWLAGHSQGGMTSRRIVCTDYFADKVDGWLSLSGGRLGSPPPSGPPRGFPGQPDGPGGEGGAPRPAAASDSDGEAPSGPSPFAAMRTDPTCDFSFIYTSGEHELRDGLPESSDWAAKYDCSARVREEDVVDERPGYVYDSTRQDPPTLGWGRLPRPGEAEVYVYPNCDGGRVVADVIRIDKGHTEGLEPEVTETLVQMIVAAPGGKARGAS